MKKQNLLLIIAVILFFNVKGQDFQTNFLGNDFRQYKNVLLKINEKDPGGFTHSFYNDLKYFSSLYDDNVLYPDLKYSFKTVKDSLSNRVFRVIDIVDKNGNTFINKENSNKPILVLKDTLSKQIIYFKYKPKSKFNFPFITSKIELDEEIFCSKIKRNTDDFTDEIKLNSPLMESSLISPLIIYKYIKNNSKTYYLSLRTYGSTVNVGETGVIILFADGTKMTKNNEIDVKAGSNSFTYSSFIRLSQADLEILKIKKIKKFRLYIYDKDITSSDADKFQIYVKCIIDKN